MSAGDFAVAAARALREVVRPLEDAFLTTEAANMLLLRHGWIPPEDEAYAEVLTARFDVTTHIVAISDSLEAVVGQPDPSPTESAAPLTALIAFLEHILEMRSSPVPPGLEGILASSEFWAEFPHDLYANLFADYVRIIHPVTFALLRVGGVIVQTRVPAAGRPNRIDYTRTELRWSRVVDMIGDPSAVARDEYGWGGTFDPTELFTRMHESLAALGVTSDFHLARHPVVDAYYTADNPIRDDLTLLHATLYRKGEPDGSTVEIAFLILPIPMKGDSDGPPVGLLVAPAVIGGAAAEFGLGGPFALQLAGGFESDPPVGIELRPDSVDVTGTVGVGPSVDVGAILLSQPRDPWVLVGARESTRLEVAGASLSLRVLGSGSDHELRLRLGSDGIRLVLDPAEADRFLSQLVGGEPAFLEAKAAIVWSSKTGLTFDGSASLTLDIPISRSLGPVSVHRIELLVEAGEGGIAGAATASGAVKIGPLTVMVNRVGVALALRPRHAGEPVATFGELGVTMAFKPPDGLGVLIDAGPITGGGFLAYDDETGRYAGAVELEVHDISVKAIGLLDTRIPGGKPAYSFVLLISAEFASISLGLGFTLNGVGGLAGIHRRMEVKELRTRLQDGSLNHLLFAKDPIKNAGRIISDLQAVFPSAKDRYVFGPMAIIGWGTPMLLEGRLGILLELPDPARLVLLGQFHVALPRKDKALIDLHLDVVGEIDPHRQRIALDGRLRDSHVVSFPIEGEMAMRLVGGDSPNFALAIGGFHPDYSPPPGFPKLQRVAILIGMDDNPRITLQGYLALTSNTLQVGAAAALYAKKGWFNISGEISFNALFTFSPFSFVTDFSGTVTLRKGNTDLAAVSLEAVLSGPTPWHAAGKACLKVRFLPDICVGFSATFGREERVPLPKVDPWPLLQAALQSLDSWNGAQPSGVLRGATLTGAPGAAGGVLLDPAFGVTLRQTVVPLHRRITKFGEAQPPGGLARFDVQKVSAAGKEVPGPDRSPVQDFFAPAQFEQLTDEEKLSRPSFERMDAGLTFAREAVSHGASVGMKVEYETRIIDSAFETRRAGIYFPVRDVQLAVAQRGAAGRAPLRNSGSSKFAPPPAQQPIAQLAAEQYIVASTVDLAARNDITPPAGKGAAYQALAAYLASHPGEHGQLEVMALDEPAEV